MIDFVEPVLDGSQSQIIVDGDRLIFYPLLNKRKPLCISFRSLGVVGHIQNLVPYGLRFHIFIEKENNAEGDKDNLKDFKKPGRKKIPAKAYAEKFRNKIKYHQ